MIGNMEAIISCTVLMIACTHLCHSLQKELARSTCTIEKTSMHWKHTLQAEELYFRVAGGCCFFERLFLPSVRFCGV